MLNWIEQTIDSNLQDMETSSNPIFQENITSQVKNHPNQIDYLASNEIVKYYLDALTLKGMVLELWMKSYYLRGMNSEEVLLFAKMSLQQFEKIYPKHDSRVINMLANTTLLMAEKAEEITYGYIMNEKVDFNLDSFYLIDTFHKINQKNYKNNMQNTVPNKKDMHKIYENVLKNAHKIEQQIISFSQNVCQNSSSLNSGSSSDSVNRKLLTRWQNSMKNSKNNFDKSQPYDELNFESAVLTYVILSKVYKDYAKFLKEEDLTENRELAKKYDLRGGPEICFFFCC